MFFALGSLNLGPWETFPSISSPYHRHQGCPWEHVVHSTSFVCEDVKVFHITKEDDKEEIWSFNLRDNEVIQRQCCCRSNVDCFFSNGGHIEGNSSLPLRFIEDSVHCLKSNHVIVHLHSNFLAHLNERYYQVHKMPIVAVEVGTREKERQHRTCSA